MNILIVLPAALMGGAERVLSNLADYFLHAGYTVTIYVMTRGNQAGWEHLTAHPNCRVVWNNFKNEKSSLLHTLYNLALMSYKAKYDYIISSHTHVNAMLSFMRGARLLRCSFLISRESTCIFDRFYGLRRLIFKIQYRFYGQQDLLVFQTAEMQVSLRKNLGQIPARAFEVLQNPVNINYIDNLRTKPLPIELNGRMIVACGRLDTIKGFDTLISAYDAVSKQYPDTVLVIIGEGANRNPLEEKISQLKLRERVILLGKTSNPYMYFAHATVGVVSSIREGFPNVLLEMMASGTKRVVTTPCTESVVRMQGVDVTQGFDAHDIALALGRILSQNEDRSKSYRQYVEKQNSAERFWGKIQLNLKDQTLL